MYTMVPEDYLKFWTDQERRCARGWTPAPAKTRGGAARTSSGRLRWFGVARHSAPLHS